MLNYYKQKFYRQRIKAILLSIGIDSLLLSLFPTKSPCPFFKSCIDE